MSTHDAIAHNFRAALLAGEKPQIEDYVRLDGSELNHSLQFRLITMEVEYRSGRGEHISTLEYEERFPESTDIIRKAIEQAFETRVSSGEVGESETPPSRVAQVENGSGDILERLKFSPEVVRRFQVRRELGRGSFAKVYLAYDTTLQLQVALKIPHLTRLENSQTSEAFLSEARRAAALDHVGIVRIHNVIEDEGRIIIVMQYVEGLSLEQLEKSRRFTPQEIAEMLAKVADAMHAAHREGTVHRDLKPANILVDDDLNPRIADFGLALHESDQHHARGEFAGTVMYMSPEQIRQESEFLDGRSDIWAMGVILYHLLFNRYPFGSTQGVKIAEIKKEILKKEPKPPRQIDGAIPHRLEEICLKCLSKGPADRYNTAADLADDLRKFLADCEPKPKPSDSVPKTTVVASSLVALILVAAAFAVYWGLKPTALRVVPPLTLESFIVGQRHSVRDGAHPEEWEEFGVTDSTDLYDDDELRISFWTSDTCYVYLALIGPDGGVDVLYPHPAIQQDNPLEGGVLHKIPDRGQWFTLTREPLEDANKPIDEQLLLVASYEPLSQFETLQHQLQSPGETKEDNAGEIWLAAATSLAENDPFRTATLKVKRSIEIRPSKVSPASNQEDIQETSQYEASIDRGGIHCVKKITLSHEPRPKKEAVRQIDTTSSNETNAATEPEPLQAEINQLTQTWDSNLEEVGFGHPERIETAIRLTELYSQLGRGLAVKPLAAQLRQAMHWGQIAIKEAAKLQSEAAIPKIDKLLLSLLSEDQENLESLEMRRASAFELATHIPPSVIDPNAVQPTFVKFLWGDYLRTFSSKDGNFEDKDKAVSSAIERIAKRMNLLGCEPWMSDLGSLLRAHESINNAHFVMALEILNTIELSILEADSLAPIFKCLYAQLRGAVEANLQAPATAMKWLDEASVRGNALGSGHRLLASITNAQSLVLLQMGDFRGAKQKCLELAESGVLQMPSKPWFDNELNLVIANQGIAVSDGDLNALNAAATRLEELVDGAISEQIPICRVTQGMNRFLAGDYEKATEHMHEALDLVSENDSHSSTQRLAECLVNVGWVDLLEGNLRDAERRFTMAIDQFIVVLGPQHPRVAEARGYRARALLELGNTDEARNEIMLALESRELLLHDVLGSSLSQRDCLAYVANLRNHWEAPHWPGVFDAYLELGPRLDIDPVDQYRHLLKWKASEARYAIPQGSSAAGPKEHALLDKLAEVRKGMRPLRWQVRDLRQTEEQRHTAVQRLDVLEQEAARLERQLRGIAPTRFGRLASSDAVTTDTICKALQDGEVLVDFLIIGVAKKIEPGSDIRPEKRLIAFILDSHGKIERVDLGELRTIELAATEFVRVCRTPPSESVSSSSSTALTDLIYRPLEPHLMDASTIFIVPDGPLYAVPFAAIPSGEADKSWIDQATLVYLPRAQALVSDRRANTSTSSPSLLLVSDVDYGALSLSPLPNSGVEADEVKAYFHQYFPNGPVDDFRALDATKPEVCRSMSAHRFVHLATHGAYLPETPTQGGGSRMAAFDWATQLDTSIVLSPGRPSDGGLLDNAILTAAEFSALDLSGVELAVLSACETGRGRVISGHGISGMPLALEQAGAANAVVSLWKVHDAGTRQLMSNFYEHLWSNEGSPGPADSLRGAQLNMQDNREHTDFSHPYYWAGFVAYQLR